MNADDSLPDDIAMLKAALIAERSRRIDAETRAAHATANMASAEVLIAHLKLAIEKMRRELYGSRSERGARLLDQMELELEDLEASAAEDEIAARDGWRDDAGSSTHTPQAVTQSLPRAPAT